MAVPASGEGIKVRVEASDNFTALLGGFVAAEAVAALEHTVEGHNASVKLSGLQAGVAHLGRAVLPELVKDTKKTGPDENSSALPIVQTATPVLPDRPEVVKGKVASEVTVEPEAATGTEQP